MPLDAEEASRELRSRADDLEIADHVARSNVKQYQREGEVQN